ncbi:alginate O-acetyltransferase complex protein AlgI [Singulisphaera sp. GP187]|uniref:MBOAT family O-acyltransferase n=1 Tax=Singulisphaera sp. GP187 TaxID=1882752 RepID=UPI0009295DF2|nr:MBOAT family protein [Singulisphaera sp. GP187]SIN93258.1 alginate O-acetyltransferase complex protein AlgI [Singulisphaera sp. GP187]
MLFCSQAFLLFFAIVFATYWALPWSRARIGLLLVASFYFYASWNRWLAALIGLSATFDYAVGLGLDRSRSARKRSLLLGLSLVANLGLLAYFKYVNFFLGSLEAMLRALGSEASLPVLRVMLPIGISFYTFEAINYTVDVYRRRVPAERNLGHFLLFITFFPHLVAGPIVRARDFLPQLRQTKRWDWARMQLGAQYFLLGLFKKLAIADRMAAFADPVFAQPSDYSTHAVWVAALAYTVQIYCDFSGYTDMAIGCAHLLGYKLAANFDLPYLSRNVSEFWRRWHISLSTWLRDYLFIPLGGSLRSRRRTYLNLLVTMTLGGLWHGASWTFVIWGAFHGFLLIGHRLFRDLCDARPTVRAMFDHPLGTLARIGLTFLTVCVGWVIFRATSFGLALAMLRRLFIPHGGAGTPAAETSFWITLLVVVVCHILAVRGLTTRLMDRLPAPVLGFGYAAILMVALVLAPDAGKPFVYFQF